MRKLIKNRAKCLKCGEIIESTHRHDFVTCSCGNLSVDGGLDYIRRGYRDGEDSFEDLNEYETLELDDLKYLGHGVHIWVKMLPTGTVRAAITDNHEEYGFVAVWCAGTEKDFLREEDYGKTWVAFQ